MQFWKEYVNSLGEVKQWGDGNPDFINYLGHPMQGSIVGFIQIQNDPKGRSFPISWSQRYEQQAESARLERCLQRVF